MGAIGYCDRGVRAATYLIVLLGAVACSVPGQRMPRPAERTLDVAGVWLLTVDSPMGRDDVQALFAQTGRQLTGTVVASGAEVPILGSVHGNAVDFSMQLSVHGEPLQLRYSGIVEDDQISGSVQFGDVASGTFSGARRIVE